MKKIFIILSLLVFSFANADCGNLDCSKEKNDCINTKTEKPADESCGVDDDEYCVYNQCYCDKHYRIMKARLSLSKQQECNIDSLYNKFKEDMEILCSRYRAQKNLVLEMIECKNDCFKEEVYELKELKKEIKNRLKCFRADVKEQLCQNQMSAFRKFNRQEKRKMKKIIKYGAIYKLPCVKCCK